MGSSAPTTKIRQHPERSVPNEAVAFLQAGLVAHVAFARDQQPYVLPFAYHFDAAEPDRLYLHGGHSSRTLGVLISGAPVAVEVTLLDALVFSKTARYHTMNYRSVVCFGRAKPVQDTVRARQVLDAMIRRYFPGRSAGADYAETPEDNLKATNLVEIEIEHISPKKRSLGPNGPGDDDPGVPGTCGVIELPTAAGLPWRESATAAAAPDATRRSRSHRAPNRFSVRRASPTDVEEVLACLRAAFEPFRDSYTPQAFLNTVLTPASMAQRLATMAIFVATDDKGHVIGTVGCQAESQSKGHLRGMAVRPDWQGTGAADELLSAAEQELHSQGCTHVTLDTTAPLRRAMRFYERNGFRRTGQVTDFYGMPLYECSKRLESASSRGGRASRRSTALSPRASR